MNFTSTDTSNGEGKKEDSKVKSFIESLSPIEKLFVVNELRNYIKNEDSELIPYLVRNPSLLDMILNLQEEVKSILNRPEQLSEGKRDPFHKNYAHEEDASSRDSDRDRSHQDHNGLSQDEESVDMDTLKKLTFKELLDRERLKESDSSRHEYMSRFVPDEHHSNGNGSRLQMLVTNKAPTTTFYPAMQQLQMQAQMNADPSMHMGYPQSQVQQPLQYLSPHMPAQPQTSMNGQGYHFMQQQMQPPMQYHQLAQNFSHAPQFAGQMHGFQGYSQMQGYAGMVQGYPQGYYGALPQSQHVQGQMLHNLYSQSPQPMEADNRLYPAYPSQQEEEAGHKAAPTQRSPSDLDSPERPPASSFDKPRPHHHSQPTAKSTFRMPPSPFVWTTSSNTFHHK